MTTAQTLEIPGYQVVQFLGNGARSTIWQVRKTHTDDYFVVKRVIKRDPADARFLSQALNEYEIGVQLEHPCIRRIYSLRKVRQWFSLHEILILMEFCNGQTIQDRRPASIADAARIFTDVAGALRYMNEQGFVHADMKPNNILVAHDGAVKVIDLGQSCRLGTVKERIQGTPDFIAPEQVHRQPLDARTDVFNFGAAFYWTLTGRPIPTSMPHKGAVSLKTEMIVKSPDQFNPDVPASLSKLIIDCVEEHPSRRPASMKDVLARLGLIALTLAKEPRVAL